MKKRIELLRVIENRQLNKEFFVLHLQSENTLPEILPGQFIEAKVEGSSTTFLRRPFSVYDVDYTNQTIQVLIKIVGDGSWQLSKLIKNDKLNIVYPLGNNFSKPKNNKVLLIGGGTGVAPMLYLGKYFRSQYNIEPRFLLGYRSADLVIDIEKFKALGETYITTEDGSMGHKGFVIHHPTLQEGFKDIDMIYTCGPEVMMKEIAKFAANKNISCEASLENLMGCGIGACLCCIVETVDSGNVNTCTEGPIFDTKRLRWLN